MIINYDTNVLHFRKIISKIYKTDDLENLHKLNNNFIKTNILDYYNDQNQDFHKKYYQSEYLIEILELYKKLLKDVIINQIYPKEEFIIFQSKPTFRIHIINNTCVATNKDLTNDTNEFDMLKRSIHCDNDLNHPEEEMNFFLPITDTNEYNTLWAESEPNKNDFKPFLLNYGEIKMAYLNKCKHGNRVNKSDKIRISLDFRIIPGSKWKGNIDAGTNTQLLKYKIGEYYDIMYNK